PAHADWPTTEWVILERADKGDPQGERARIADKYRILLEYGSRWYQSMSFNAPHQLRETKFFRKGRYVGLLKQDTSDNVSAHGSSAKVGNMYLSSYPGFMKPETQVDQLLQA